MQAQTRPMHPALRARAVQGKHAKRARNAPARKARRILVSALLLSGLAAGSAAASENATTTGHVSTHHQTAVGSIKNSPWMY